MTGKLVEGVEWQKPLCWSQTGRSVLLPGRAAASPFPGCCLVQRQGDNALGAIMGRRVLEGAALTGCRG